MTKIEDINNTSSNEQNIRPLCVDLDGTLLRTDLLVESFFLLLKRNMLYLFLLPFWLLKGKAHLKQQIADRVDIDVSLLPYHGDFLDYLKQQHSTGRRLILATASNKKFAEAVAEHAAIFDTVLASDAETNLSGSRKLAPLVAEFGEGGFDYAGNAMIDFKIWQHAAEVILVNPERGVKKAAEKEAYAIRLFDDRQGHPLTPYLKAMRLHQWLKNLLLFVPLVMAHQFTDYQLLGQAMLAFLAFGLCASSVYLLNDLLDLPDDRRHPTKCNRPFAAGRLSIVTGTLLMPVLLLLAFAIALLLPIKFFLVLLIYYASTLAYSFKLKRVALVDVLALAGLYTIRIIAGAAAVSVIPTFWLLAFSMFLFLSLALVKRFTELLALDKSGQSDAAGRGYSVVDLETLSHFGSTSAYMAVLVLALYINSETVKELYSHPEVIWLLCPLLLYMVTRIWLLARRDQLHEDPVIFVIKDRTTLWIAMMGALLLWLAV
ncbi:MAG: UbiA family prenyltransferase [Candidatus Polarisedimenticolaceae bacterium]|nr:UbiA family prenyltransferase [Candidatus Polarisedimenticolaceae bacterium]